MANLNNYNYFLGNDIKLISIFKNNNRNYITYTCNIHGEHTQRLDCFNGCKECNKILTGEKISNSQSHSLEDVKKWVSENSTAELISTEYKKQSDDYWFKCECGNGFKTSINTFKQKNKRVCDICSEKIRVSKRQSSEDEIINYIKKYSSLEYLYHYRKDDVGEVYVTLRCECGNEIHTKKANLKFFKIEKCAECRTKDISFLKKINISDIMLRLKPLNLTLLDTEYNGQYSEINLKCNLCEFEFIDKFINIVTRHRICPNCSPYYSKGSKKIYDFLNKNNIIFETEYYFKNLKVKKYLRFDFFLPDYNMLLEFDGEYHYITRATNLIGMNNYFKAKKYDYLKNKFCRENFIKLVRIPFWEADTINKYLKYLLKI